MMPVRCVALLFACFLASSHGMSVPALAQAKKQTTKQASNDGGTFQIGTYGDWGAFVSGKDKGKVCYAMSQPKDRAPRGLSRDPAFVFVSAKGNRFEVSVIMGYPLKPGAAATAAVSGDSYALLTKDKSAWLRNTDEEKDVVDALRKGSAMIVKGTSLRGNDTTDRYSLAGAGQAIDRMQKECQ